MGKWPEGGSVRDDGTVIEWMELLFYSFTLEDHIPANHLLRRIDQCLDLSDLRQYSPQG
jgi:hypothetical protein